MPSINQGYGVGRVYFPAVKKRHDPFGKPAEKVMTPSETRSKKVMNPLSENRPNEVMTQYEIRPKINYINLILIKKSHDPVTKPVEKSHDYVVKLAEKRS